MKFNDTNKKKKLRRKNDERQTTPTTRPEILALHRLLFEEDGDRCNRQRLHEFTGFVFGIDSEEYRAKIDYAVRLGIGDLISIYNVLGLDYTGNKEQLRERIILGRGKREKR